MKTKAFTLLEMLVVFALTGIFFGLVLFYTQVTQVRADLYGQVDAFIGYARLAQSDAATGKDGLEHGLHLETDSYTIFSGSVYNPLDTANDLIELPPTVEIQNVSLNGAGTDIIFAPPRGETSTYGSLDFVSTSTSQIITITLDANGRLDY